MSLISIFIIAVGLAMDALAVSLGVGAAIRDVTPKQTLRVSTSLGFFQGTMPILGWSAGKAVHNVVSTFDHWIAFALLCLIGVKMIVNGFHQGSESFPGNPTGGILLLGLAVATSIDALAVGVSLAMMRVTIWFACVIIAVITLLLSVLGIQTGKHVGAKMGKWADLFGGIVLCSLGITILVTHTI